MTPPRRISAGAFFYVTARCVNRSFRLVPNADVCQAIRYCLAYVSQKYRDAGQLELYEFVFMSNHLHILGRDLGGVLPRFVCEFNSLLSRQLNALRGIRGRNFEDGYGLQVIEGDERVLEHAVYTLMNPVAALLVVRARGWKGVGSAGLQYGESVLVSRPTKGLWSHDAAHARRHSSQRSKRARFANRSKLPRRARLVLDRPPIKPELSDTQLREAILQRVAIREAEVAEERRRLRRRVLGMAAVRRHSFLTMPHRGEEMFATRPSFSASDRPRRQRLAKIRRAFLEAYAAARDAFRGGDRDVKFPEGTWQMRERYRVRCEALCVP